MIATFNEFLSFWCQHSTQSEATPTVQTKGIRVTVQKKVINNKKRCMEVEDNFSFFSLDSTVVTKT